MADSRICNRVFSAIGFGIAAGPAGPWCQSATISDSALAKLLLRELSFDPAGASKDLSEAVSTASRGGCTGHRDTGSRRRRSLVPWLPQPRPGRAGYFPYPRLSADGDEAALQACASSRRREMRASSAWRPTKISSRIARLCFGPSRCHGRFTLKQLRTYYRGRSKATIALCGARAGKAADSAFLPARILMPISRPVS